MVRSGLQRIKKARAESREKGVRLFAPANYQQLPQAPHRESGLARAAFSVALCTAVLRECGALALRLLLKGGAFLEQIGKITVVCFDIALAPPTYNRAVQVWRKSKIKCFPAYLGPVVI